MIKEYISKVVEGQNLSFNEAKDLMNEITSGNATNAQIAAILVGLRMKGETIDEIAGLASVMKEKSNRINPKVKGKLIDTCGTGGAKLKTFNISTIVAFVAAGIGIPIAKHGNRSFTSACGGADVLEALGTNINLKPEQVEKVIEKVGIGFLFAPSFHPSMKYASEPRKEMGIRTVFNILGPLTNPANAKAQLLGVFSEELVPKMTGALQRLGTEKALVVYGVDGLDEISTLGKTIVAEIDNNKIKNYELHPKDFGFKTAKPEDIAGASPEKSAEIVRNILQGQKGLMRDIVLLNAGAAIYVGGKAKSIKDGIELAKESIDSGKAYKKLNEFIEATKNFVS
jgi:anthranilate phosphoribosyltransferase